MRAYMLLRHTGRQGSLPYQVALDRDPVRVLRRRRRLGFLCLLHFCVDRLLDVGVPQLQPLLAQVLAHARVQPQQRVLQLVLTDALWGDKWESDVSAGKRQVSSLVFLEFVRERSVYEEIEESLYSTFQSKTPTNIQLFSTGRNKNLEQRQSSLP